MKKLLLLLTLSFSLAAGAQTMVVDSVTIVPQNPTALDSVYLVIHWHCGWGTTQMTPSVTHAGNNHTVTACYFVGMITLWSQDDDSIFLFQGPAGIHNVSWTVVQNATGNSQCDLPVAGNQLQVNVLATEIEEHVSENPVHWNQSEQQFAINQSGIFTVYSSTGQLMHESTVVAGQRVIVRGYPAQMYFATLRQENGEITTVTFVLE